EVETWLEFRRVLFRSFAHILPIFWNSRFFAGGSIKNIALGAAFLAQSEGEAIGMRQIILAAKREFQKMGKICAKADFGDFYALRSEERRVGKPCRPSW